MIRENEKLRQYLLGSLIEDEMKEVDLRIISDENLEADLHLAENELMEDYLENNLTAEEAKKFEKEFLSCDERREDLDLLRLIKKRAIAAPEIIPVTAKKETGLFTQMVRGWFPAPALAAAAVVLVFFGFYWVAISPDSTSNNIAQLNLRDLSNLDEFKDFSKVNVSWGNYRDSNNNVKLSGSDLTDRVLARLALPPHIKTEGVFDVTLLRNDVNISTLKDRPSYSNPGGQEIRLLIPREEMKKGSYKVEVRRGTESPLVYSFTVE